MLFRSRRTYHIGSTRNTVHCRVAHKIQLNSTLKIVYKDIRQVSYKFLWAEVPHKNSIHDFASSWTGLFLIHKVSGSTYSWKKMKSADFGVYGEGNKMMKSTWKFYISLHESCLLMMKYRYENRKSYSVGWSSQMFFKTSWFLEINLDRRSKLSQSSVDGRLRLSCLLTSC